MHELSVCLGILGHVEKLAREHRARSVSRIRVSVGPLSGIDIELLKRAFPLAREGTVAASAELVAEAAPIRVHCSRCQEETEATPNRLLCGACGEWRTRVVSGDGMLLTGVDLEVEEESHV